LVADEFVVVFAGAEAPWVLRERELVYQSLGPALQPSRTANFRFLASELRARAPQATWDERLVRPASQSQMLGRTLRIEEHVEFLVGLVAAGRVTGALAGTSSFVTACWCVSPSSALNGPDTTRSPSLSPSRISVCVSSLGPTFTGVATALPSTEQAESPSFTQASPGCAIESSQAASDERDSQPLGPRQVLASFQWPAAQASRFEPPASHA